MESANTETGQDARRIDDLRQSLLLAPRDIETMRALANLLERSGDLPGAVDLHQRALRVDPYHLGAILDLARLWRELADPERGKSWYRRALAIDPDCADAALGLAADDAEALSEAYIRTLFDQYADRFDRELVETLHYRAPDLVAALLSRQNDSPTDARILDLGCGTGLSGLALKPFARMIDGVDLSPGMIAKAQSRNLYRRLVIGDARAFLRESTENWDVIAAIDVLNYIGDLVPIFTAAAARLAPGGFLAGTVEKRRGGAALTAKRRHSHARVTLLEALESAGLNVDEVAEEPLRTEAGAPVAGLIFVARAGH
jgi:predicted TPR repeat methyltransferase